MNFNIKQISLFDLLDGENCYRIPDYQRAYEWKKETVQELWEDLMQNYMDDLSETSDEYLLGPIVVEKDAKMNSENNTDCYFVVDGQQRLITLTLLFCAVRESINEYLTEDVSDVDKEIKKELINDINEITIQNGEGIISLNDDKSNHIFQSIQLGKTNIKKLSEKLKLKYQQELNAPSKNLIKNYRILLVETESLCKKCKLESTGTELVKAIGTLKKIIQNIRKKNLFVYVNIFNDEYSHQVFQSLNSKGQALNQAALVKSYLLKLVKSYLKDPPANLDVNGSWKKIMDKTESKYHDALLYESLLSRTSKGPEPVKKYLFKFIKNKFKGKPGEKKYQIKQRVDRYLKELETDSKYIHYLNSPGKIPNNWQPTILHAFYGLQQIKAIYIRRPIIAACREWGLDKKTVQLVDCLLKFFFMYRTICEYNIDKLKKISRTVTEQILTKQIPSEKKLNVIFWTILKHKDKVTGTVENIQTDDFKRKFEEKIHDLSDLGVATYILYSLEYDLNKPGGKPSNGKLEVEHVYPKNPGKNWEENLSAHTDRLGNLTLLSPECNKICSNRSYKEKRNGITAKDKEAWEINHPDLSCKEDCGYLKSGVKLNKTFQKYTEWNLHNLKDREEELCKIAYRVWDLSTYSKLAKDPDSLNS